MSRFLMFFCLERARAKPPITGGLEVFIGRNFDEILTAQAQKAHRLSRMSSQTTNVRFAEEISTPYT